MRRAEGVSVAEKPLASLRPHPALPRCAGEGSEGSHSETAGDPLRRQARVAIVVFREAIGRTGRER